MKYSPTTEVSTVAATGILLAGLLLAGCSEQMITGPSTFPETNGTSVTGVNVTNQDARHNESDGQIHADKNGENSTTYGGDHNL